MTLPQPISKYVFFLVGALLFAAALETPAAATATLTFNPNILRFGEVVVGQSESLPVTVTNASTTSYGISAISTSAIGFSLSYPALPLTLAPGESFVVTVTFQPTSSASSSGSIAFNGNALLPLRGSGMAIKSLIPNPPSVYFGNVQTGNTSKVLVTLTNAKNGTVTVNGDLMKGAGFAVTGLSLPLTLTPGQSYTFTVSFSPSSTGLVNGSFQGLNLYNYTNVLIPLSGAGTAPGQLSVSPASVSFGNVNVGTTVSRTASLTAAGSSVTVTSAGSSSSEFSLSGISLPTTIAAGQSLPYTVLFKPQSSGTASATLSFSTNTSTVSESLTGSGIALVTHSVSLSWQPSTSQVTGYNVYRSSAAAGPFAKINSSLAPSTAYVDGSVAASQTYYYVTTAVNSSGQESAYSNEVQVVVP